MTAQAQLKEMPIERDDLPNTQQMIGDSISYTRLQNAGFDEAVTIAILEILDPVTQGSISEQDAVARLKKAGMSPKKAKAFAEVLFTALHPEKT